MSKSQKTGPAAEPEGERRGSNPLPPLEVLHFADTAVTKLDLRKFLEQEDYFAAITKRLEDADEDAERTPVNGEMMFMALTLPLTNGIIHIGSNRQALGVASQWASEEWKGFPDPLSILSALTLVHIVRTAWEKNNKNPEKYEQWHRITRRVKRFSEKIDDKATSAAPTK